MVNLGKGAMLMGWVVMVVDIGDFFQSSMELVMKYTATMKPPATTRVQSTLVALFLAVDIWERPWMVEDSRNSLRESIRVVAVFLC